MKGTQQSSCSRQTYKSQKCTNIRQAQGAETRVDPKRGLETTTIGIFQRRVLNQPIFVKICGEQIIGHEL